MDGEVLKTQEGRLQHIQSKSSFPTADTVRCPQLPNPLVPGCLFLTEPGTIARKANSVSNVRYPYGNPVVPRLPQRASYEDSLFLASRTSQPMAALPNIPAGGARGKLNQSLPDNTTLQVSPRNIPHGAEQTGAVEDVAKLPSWLAPQVESKAPCEVHIPRHQQLPPSARHYVSRPFSEEVSTIAATPESDSPTQHQHQSPDMGPEVPKELVTGSREIEAGPSNRPASISPDYMLVGAHISGNQLVLLNREGQIVHQLTETDLDANTSHSETCVDGNLVSARAKSPPSEDTVPAAPQLLPPPPSRLTGTRPPPPTAADGARAHGQLQGRTSKDSNFRSENSKVACSSFPEVDNDGRQLVPTAQDPVGDPKDQ